MGFVVERRWYDRYRSKGLLVIVEGEACPVVDISIAGLSFAGPELPVGSQVTLTLADEVGQRIPVEASITVKAAGPAVTRGELAPSAPPLRFILKYLEEVLGVTTAVSY